MAFPINPIDGQQYTNALGTRYIYVAVDTSWEIESPIMGVTGMQGVTGVNGYFGITGYQGQTGIQGTTGLITPYDQRRIVPAEYTLPKRSQAYQTITGMRFYLDPNSTYNIIGMLMYTGSLMMFFNGTPTVTGCIGFYGHEEKVVNSIVDSVDDPGAYASFYGTLINMGSTTGAYNVTMKSGSYTTTSTVYKPSHLILKKIT